jgi:hypothetical protein
MGKSYIEIRSIDAHSIKQALPLLQADLRMHGGADLLGALFDCFLFRISAYDFAFGKSRTITIACL